MSYKTKINDNVHTLDANQVLELTYALGLSPEIRVPGEGKVSYTPNAKDIWGTYRVNGKLLGTSNLKLNAPSDTTYIIKNTDAFDEQYNLYDVIAVAKAEGISDKKISDALNGTGISRDTVGKQKLTWDENYIAQYSRETTDTSRRIYNFLNTNGYPNAKVITLLDSDGNDYSYAIEYTDANNIIQYEKIDSADLEDVSDDVFNSRISKMLETNATLNNIVNAPAGVVSGKTNLAANAQADYDIGKAVLERLDAGGFKNANTANDLSDEEWQSITAALPSTDDLKAWNGTKDTAVFNKLITNLKETKPQLLERMSYDQLKGLADAVSSEQQTVTERSIKNQQAQLLQNIVNDPSLYDAVVKQQRADAASNIIAGQRAANTQATVTESNTGYDDQAAKLYESLFGGEQNVAAKTYNDAMSSKIKVLDTDIQQKLDDAMSIENQRASSISKLTTMLEALGKAAGVDVAKWADSISEEQAVAGGKANTLVSAIKDKLTTAQADNTANVDKVRELFGEAASYVNQGNANGVNVTDAITQLADALKVPVASSGYKTVNAPEYEKAKQFDNKQYNDLTDSEFLNWILSNNTVDSATKAKTLEEFIKSGSGLDILTLEGLTNYYDTFNKESTAEANKVFNQAQRAYIAAITAGDAKTAEQLTRLASRASTSKRNLFAASALANQFKQQTALGTNGRQLATDFLNQQSFNRSQAAQANYDAATAQLKYLGNGNGNYDRTTLYDVYNKHLNNSAQGFDAYGKFGSTIMGHNQDMSSLSVDNNIQNHNRFVDVANQYTSVNAGGAAVNTTAQSAIETLRAQALAKQAQALNTNPNIKR